MAKAPTIESLLKNGSTEWNKLRKAGKVSTDHTGATFAQLFSANTDLSNLTLVGSEWEKCDLSKINFREADLSNAYFHGGRLQDCDFRGANLDGATFERMKMLRCDFTGAQGLEALELDEVDLDRVIGLDGEEAPPPPPPPVHGVTSFTREQRTAAESMFGGAPTGNEPPPFRPQDSAGSLVFRALKDLTPPLWALDVPGLRLPTPSRLTSGSSLESQLRDVVKARLDGRPATTDPATEGKAHQALRMGAKDAALAALYLKEIGVDPHFRFSAAKALRAELRRELEVDDPTGQVDPRTAGALLTLSLTHEAPEFLGEVRRRLAAAQLFQALLEAGFTPENNWEEAVDASEAAIELTATAGLEREALGEAFGDFTNLPDEVRFRRLAYLGEAAISLEQLARLPEGTEPAWLTGPEYRECHDREMEFVQALTAEQIPQKVPELAETELSVPKGTIPEDSDSDLFLHFRCSVCGKEKLLVQSPE